MKKPELLSPAGDLEKLKIAVIYGADAVYLGTREYSLRTLKREFPREDMLQGLEFARERGVKVYVAVNIIPRHTHLPGIRGHLRDLREAGPGGLIVSDPAVIELCREECPGIPLHLSTQVSTTNWRSARFWQEQGISRINLARELSLEEIKEIRQRVGVELEYFVHGAMCVSYSGRCLLSNYLAHRDANRGECAQPCRWKYQLVEEKRPGQFHPVYEDRHGSYIFNSRDLCLLEHLDLLLEAGIDSLKIEGRMKSAYYVAAVTRVYRQALDQCYLYPGDYNPRPEWREELEKVSHRPYSTGFFLGIPPGGGQAYEGSSYIREYDFVGMVKGYNRESGLALVEQRNFFARGEELELLSPADQVSRPRVEKMYTLEGEEVEKAPHPCQLLQVDLGREAGPYDILRRAR